jgi:hypothetical protein
MPEFYEVIHEATTLLTQHLFLIAREHHVVNVGNRTKVTARSFYSINDRSTEVILTIKTYREYHEFSDTLIHQRETFEQVSPRPRLRRTRLPRNPGFSTSESQSRSRRPASPYLRYPTPLRPTSPPPFDLRPSSAEQVPGDQSDQEIVETQDPRLRQIFS